MMNNESDEDDWQPTDSTTSLSMFEKLNVKFTNDQIQKKEEQMLSAPHFFNDDDIDAEQRPKQTQKTQCLYDPLEDDENQNWFHRAHQRSRAKSLVCPSCFTPVAYSYKCLPNGNYSTANPSNIQVLETKVIRNRQCPERMNFSLEEDYQKIFQQREQEFNIKILCVCLCGADIGYYDVNKAAYVLSNVV